MKPNLEKIKSQKTISELLEFGILNIDKPSGPTSFNVSDFVRKKLGLRKTSHFGTLDPKVTGVLPIALNRACKLTGYFIGHDKKYVGIMRLHENIEMEKIQEVINKKFLGKIKQTPPVKSRVARREREREIKSFELLERDKKDILFRVGCEGGTYIRKLCLHPNTEILSKEGLIKINQIDKKNNVCTLNEKNINYKNPSAFQKIISPNKLIKIKTSSGIEFIVTPDHQMLVSTEEGYKMKECTQLNTEDYLVKNKNFTLNEKEYTISDMLDDDYLIEQPEIKEICKQAMIKKYGSIRAMNRKIKLDRKAFLNNSSYAISIKHLKLSGVYEDVKSKLKIFKTPKGKIIKIKRLTENHFYLMGLIASDGNNTKEKGTKRYTRIKFHNKEKKLIDKFIEIYTELFPTIKISKKKVRENLFELDSSNSLFASILKYFGIVSPERDSELLPILYCKKEYVKSFLKGYFDGDGNAFFSEKKKKNGHYSNIRIYCVHYPILKRIHQMLLKIGIWNKIIETKTNFSEMFCIELMDLESKRKFAKEISSYHPLKKKYLDKILNHKNTNYEGDSRYIGFHYKKFLEEHKTKLNSLGGNLHRLIKSSSPLTIRTYKKAKKILLLPELDDLIIEKIKEIKILKGEDYVYDMTIPKTHNFLIETGYISSNCHDLGKEIGIGAHMLELRRTDAGIFSEENSVNLYDFEKAVEEYKNGKWDLLKKIIIPAEEAIKKVYPVVEIKRDNLKQIFTGKPIYKNDLVKNEKFEKGKIVCCFCGKRFIGMYKISDDKNIFARGEFVVQEIK